MNLQDTMMLYGVTLGKRRTKRQRYRFLQQMEDLCRQTGYPIRVQTPAKGGKLIRTENIILGDPDRAKVLFVAPFDTPTRALTACRYYPFHPELTIREERRDILFHGLVALPFILLAYFPASTALERGGWWLSLLAVAAAMILYGLRHIHGAANPVNFNRSSASVAVCAKLCQELNGNKNAAFAFCDRATTSYEGYKLLAKDLPANLTVVLLDCIAQGDQLVLAHGTLANLKAKRLLDLLPQSTMERTYEDDQLEGGRNLLSLFPSGMLLTSGSIEEGELVVYNTRSPKDVGLDLPRLELIQKSLLTFAQGK